MTHAPVVILLILVFLVVPIIFARRSFGNRAGWGFVAAACLMLSLVGCFITVANSSSVSARKTLLHVRESQLQATIDDPNVPFAARNRCGN